MKTTHPQPPKVFDHTSYEYQMLSLGKLSLGGKQNGAYWYSVEITENIAPRIDTMRNWVTVNVPGRCYDHSIVFIHNNNHPEWYKWLRRYKDLILVCGIRSTVQKMQTVLPMHHAIYVPLSIDTEYVRQFKTRHTMKACFAGRSSKSTILLPIGIDYLADIPRDELLCKMAKYKTVYAVGRCALEAKCLGCKIGVYDDRYPDPSIWEVLDNSEAAEILQEKLDIIDEKGN